MSFTDNFFFLSFIIKVIAFLYLISSVIIYIISNNRQMGWLYHVSKWKENLITIKHDTVTWHICVFVLKINFYLLLQKGFIWKWYLILSNVFESLIWWIIRNMIWEKQLWELKFEYLQEHFFHLWWILVLGATQNAIKYRLYQLSVAYSASHLVYRILCHTLVSSLWFFSDSAATI